MQTGLDWCKLDGVPLIGDETHLALTTGRRSQFHTLIFEEVRLVNENFATPKIALKIIRFTGKNYGMQCKFSVTIQINKNQNFALI